MLSNGRGALVSHGKLLWRQGRDSFLVLPFRDQPLPFTLCATLGLLQDQVLGTAPCTCQACWQGVPVLSMSVVQS